MSGQLWTARLIFSLSGLSILAWALLVPYAKIKFHLSDGELGGVLFLASTGGVAVMFLASLVVARWGSRACIIAALILTCLLLPALVYMPTVLSFTVLLFLYSANFGVLDVSINAQGAVIEARSGRLQMSGFHACFSLGSLVIAVAASALLKIGVAAEWICCLCVAMILLGLTQSFRLLPGRYDAPRTGRHFVFPNLRTLILGLCCFTCFMCDGAATDWSTVFLHFSRHMALATAVLGYAAYAVATTLTCLTGDRLAMRLGQASLMRLGVVIAVLGFGLVVLVPSGIVGIIGFGLVGIGTGNIIPLIFSAATRVPGMASHHSLPIVVGVGYVGFLAGPVMVGLVSIHFGLSTAFIVDAALLGTSFLAAHHIA